MSAKRLFIITGDYSGDVHAANVVKALRRHQPDMEIAAVGGVNLQALGVHLVSDQSKMGRLGFGSIMGIPYHWMLGRKVLKFLEDFRPDAVLLIDYGMFNLWMAQQLKARGIKVFYFIPPQVWVSRKGRLKKIKAFVDHVFCIFPFEEALYQSHHIPVTYVGHPLIGQLPPPPEREAFCKQWGLSPESPIVGLFPGSRKMEIDYLLRVIVGSIPAIRQKQPKAQFVLAKAPSLKAEYFNQCLEQAMQSLSEADRQSIVIVENQNHAIMGVSDAVLLTSGTVTLEAALYQTPMVILYKLHPIVYEVAIRITYLSCVGLPNILTDIHNLVYPELLQRDATSENLAQLALKVLDPASLERKRQEDGFKHIQEQLSKGNAVAGGVTRNVALEILRLIGAELQDNADLPEFESESGDQALYRLKV